MRETAGAEKGRAPLRLRQGDTVAAWLESGVTDGLANYLGDGWIDSLYLNDVNIDRIYLFRQHAQVRRGVDGMVLSAFAKDLS
ncbi:hypothetical protein [Delftia acidovorans]|uniref:hypothetical protein n=1 Tax=Delftia acidovorans TaxID=80866 RepID=UPI0033403D1E